MWRECAEKHAVFQCCRASVPASTFRASAERLAVFIGSGTSKAIDLRGETPVRAPFSSVRAPDMRFRQLSRDRVPACSLCTNPASAEGMAWFARSDASKSLDSGRKTAVRALIPGGRAQQLRLWRSLFRAHYSCLAPGENRKEVLLPSDSRRMYAVERGYTNCYWICARTALRWRRCARD